MLKRFDVPLKFVTRWPKTRQTYNSVHQLNCFPALSYLDNVLDGIDPELWLPSDPLVDKLQWLSLYPLEQVVKSIQAAELSSAIGGQGWLPRNVFLRHQGVLSPRPQFYDSSLYVHKYYMGITFVALEDSIVPMRGFDIVFFHREPSHMMVDGESIQYVHMLYLKPLSHKQGWGRTPQWKEPWYGHTFVPMMLPPHFRDLYEGRYFPVKNIAWSFEPEGVAGDISEDRGGEKFKNMRLTIPKALRGTVKHVIDQIKIWHSAHQGDEAKALLEKGVQVLPRIERIPQDGDGADAD